MIQYLLLPDERRLAYHFSTGRAPMVMFLGGFNSNMNGAKALALEQFCRERGQAFLRFDYTGHGESSGAFADGCISDWLQDATDVFDQLTQGEVILIGSSMGAWIALLLALRRKDRVRALITIAAAPDFTEKLIWQQLTEAQKQEMQQNGVIHLGSCYGSEPYPIIKKLIEDGRTHLLLDQPIALNCPVRLLHGSNDQDVPWHISTQLMEKLEAPDAQLTLIKSGDHRLSSPEQLAVMMGMLETLL